jgi:hypothetical protein
MRCGNGGESTGKYQYYTKKVENNKYLIVANDIGIPDALPKYEMVFIDNKFLLNNSGCVNLMRQLYARPNNL